MTLRCAHARPNGAQGMYPVVREDAAQMAALQMQAEHGPALAKDPEAFEASLEKVLTKQARFDAWRWRLSYPQSRSFQQQVDCRLHCCTAYDQVPCTQARHCFTLVVDSTIQCLCVCIHKPCPDSRLQTAADAHDTAPGGVAA